MAPMPCLCHSEPAKNLMLKIMTRANTYKHSSRVIDPSLRSG